MISRSHIKLVAVFLLKLVGTGVFLYWAFSQVEDKEALSTHFKRAMMSPFWVCAGLACGGVAVIAGALRWYILLRVQKFDVTYLYIVRLTLIAALFNIVSIGGAAGNAARLISVMRRHRGKKLSLSLTVLMDHLVGFVSTGTIFLIFLWGTGLLEKTENSILRHTLIGAAVFEMAGLIGILLLFLISTERGVRIIRRKLPRLAKRRHFDTFMSCLQAYRSHWKGTLLSLGAAVFLSLSYFMAFYAALRTIGEKVEVSTMLTVMPIVDVVSSLPISVSGVGVREKTFEYLMSSLTSISSGAAVSTSLIGFLFHVFWGLVGGVVLIFWRAPQVPQSQIKTD